MKCSKCGFMNSDNASICLQCGNYLQEESFIEIQDLSPSTLNNVSNSMETPNSIPVLNITYINFVKSILLRPITTLRDGMANFENAKFSIIFMLIISGIMTIINLGQTVFNLVYIKSVSWLGDKKGEWVWSNLKYLKWGEVIFKKFLIYSCIIAGLALIYFLASLILKKQISYIKLLGIVSISIIPIIIINLLISSIISVIYFPLSPICSSIGLLYTVLLLIYGVEMELKLENNDLKLFVNLICLSIFISIIYFIYLKDFFLLYS